MAKTINLKDVQKWLMDDGPELVFGRFPSKIAILHPGARPVDDDPELPFRSGDPSDERMTERQMNLLTKTLLGYATPGARVGAALYGGYLRERELERVADELSGISVDGPRLDYILVAGTLEELNPVIRAETDFWKPVTHLWAEDGSWFFSSPEDIAFSVVAGPETLTERLLSVPTMHAVPWPEG